MMTVKEFKKALRESRNVFAWVVATKHDGVYLQVTKKSCALYADECDDVEIKANLREDNDLYID